MSMLTLQGELAAHMAADLSVQFARRHAAQGRHDDAARQYRDAAGLYAECGCEAMEAVAVACEEKELALHQLYRVRP